MTHNPEFTTRPAASPVESQAARDLAACYARVFLGAEDGRRVLADLRKKFGLSRLVFDRGEDGRLDALAAALRDGERRVLHEIESALELGAPLQKQTANA